MHVHVSAVRVLAHRVCELCDSVAGRSQPRLDLGQVEDDLPVSDGVERRRFSRPATQQSQCPFTFNPPHPTSTFPCTSAAVTSGRRLLPAEAPRPQTSEQVRNLRLGLDAAGPG